jgi:2-haloacid dehalogenase
MGLTMLMKQRKQTSTLHGTGLVPGRDVVAGLNASRQKYVFAPRSNGNISLMVNLARRNGFVWDAILGAEVAQPYKPTRVVYTSIAAALIYHQSNR